MKKKNTGKVSHTNNWNAILKSNSEQFKQKLNFMKKMLNSWHKSNESPFSLDDKKMLIKYAGFIERVNNQQSLQKDVYFPLISSNRELQKAKDERSVYLGVNFLENKLWKINFSTFFVYKLENFSIQFIQELFLLIYVFTQGYLPFDDVLNEIEKRQTQSYFLTPIQAKGAKRFLLIKIGVQKLPIFFRQKKTIQSFEYIHFIQCQSILQAHEVTDKMNLTKIVNYLELQNIDNPKLNFQLSQLIPVDYKYKNKDYSFDWKPQKDRSTNFQKLYSLEYKKLQANQIQNQKFMFKLAKFKFQLNKKVYLFKNIKCFQQNKQDKKEYSQDNILLMKDISKNINSILSNSDFHHNLNQNQQQLLLKDQNFIVESHKEATNIFALIKLFGLQYVTKINGLQINQKCQIQIFEKMKSNQNLFLAYSSTQIEKLKILYKKIILLFKKQHSQQCEKCRSKFCPFNQQLNDQDPIETLMKKIKNDCESLQTISQTKNEKDSVFSTVDAYLKTIDIKLLRPFYDHKMENQNLKKQSIKKSYINRYDYFDYNLRKIQMLKALFVDYNIFKDKFWGKLPKLMNQNIKLSDTLLSPLIVWHQIMFIIKGSIYSWMYPFGFIGLDMYLNEKKSLIQSFKNYDEIQIKKIVYMIFKIYQNWCKTDNAYDYMDFVNHLLQQTQYFDQKYQKINSMIINQVQLLTPATIYLLSKMVNSKIIYIGDTNATSFEINNALGEIKQLFDNKICKKFINLKMPQGPINLLKNYKAHNRILEMANFVKDSIKTLFPKMISNTNRIDQSIVFGPKPIIILNRIDLFFKLMCGQNSQDQIYITQNQNKPYKKHQQNIEKLKLNNKQIIIVRNQEQKYKLPDNLRIGTVLTLQQAKGREYQQIVLFNFFSSCPCLQSWKIFDCLEIEYKYQSSKQFESKINQSYCLRQQKCEFNEEIKTLLNYDFNRNQYLIQKIALKSKRSNMNVNTLYNLAEQLKLLYNIIIGAKSVFAIYDNIIPQNLLKLWKKMNLMNIVSADNVTLLREEIQNYTKRKRQQLFMKQQELFTMKGCDHLVKKQFQQAKKYFARAKRFDLSDRIQIIQIEIQTKKQLNDLKLQFDKIKQEMNYKIKKSVKIKYQEKKQYILDNLIKAGNIFVKNKNYKAALQLFEKAQAQKQMLNCYKALNDKPNIIKYYMQQNLYVDAIPYLEQKQFCHQLVICYAQTKNQTKFRQLITKIKNQKNIKLSQLNKNHILQKMLECFSGLNLIFIEKQQNIRQIQNACQEIKEKRVLFNGQQHKQQINKIITNRLYSETQRLIKSMQQVQKINEKFNGWEKVSSSISKDQSQVKAIILELSAKLENIVKVSQNDQIKYIQEFELNWTKDKNKIINYNIDDQIIQSIVNEIKQIISLFYPDLISDQIKLKEKIFGYNKSSIQQINKTLNNGNQLLELLQKVQKAEQINSCLFICSSYPELLPLAYKFISSQFLKYSLIYKSKNQVMQWPEQLLTDNKQQLNLAFKFLLNINNNLFGYKISKIILKDTTFISSFANELVPELILQGFYKVAIKLCDSATAFKLACICSSQDLAIKQIGKMVKQLSFDGQIKYYSTSELLSGATFPEFNFFKQTRIINTYRQYLQLCSQIFQDRQDNLTSDESQHFFKINFIDESQDVQSKDTFGLDQQHLKQLNILKGKLYQYANLFKMIKKKNEATRQITEEVNKLRYHKFEQEKEKLSIELLKLQKQLFAALQEKKKAQISKSIKCKKENDIAQLKVKLNQKISKNKTSQIKDELNELIETYAKELKYEAQTNQKYEKLYQEQLLLQKKKKENLKFICEIQNDWKYQEKTDQEISKAIEGWFAEQIKEIEKNKKLKQLKAQEKNKQNQINKMKQDFINKSYKNKPSKLNKKQQKTETQKQEESQTLKKTIKKQLTFNFQSFKQFLIELITKAFFRFSNISQSNYFWKIFYYDLNRHEISEQDQYNLNHYYWNILYNCSKIKEYQAQKNRQQICNTLMFYINILFDRKFTDKIKKLEAKADKYFKNQKEKTQKIIQQILQQISYYSNEQYYSERQNLNTQNKIVTKLKKELQIKAQQLMYIKGNINMPPSNFPTLRNLLNIMKSIIIKIQDYPIIRQMLYQFFHCKIVQKCSPLDLFANEFVIIRSNSVLIDHIKWSKSNVFFYNFDSQMQLVLCPLQDFECFFKQFILQTQLLFEMSSNQLNQKEISLNSWNQNKIKSDKISKAFYLSAFNSIFQSKRIISLFDNQFQKKQTVKQIKSLKRQLLSYYYQNQFQSNQHYFVIEALLKELAIVQKIHENGIFQSRFAGRNSGKSKVKFQQESSNFEKEKQQTFY